MKTTVAGSNGMVGSTITHRVMIHKVLLACGVLSALVWLGTDIIASLSYAGYNYPFAAISELSAIGAPTRPYIGPMVTIYTVLKIAFAVGVWKSAGQKRALRITAVLLFAWGANDLAASFFPLHTDEPVESFANTMHSILTGGIGVPLMLLPIAFGAGAGGKLFRFYSYGTFLFVILSGAVMAFIDFPRIAAHQPTPWFGLEERIVGYGDMLWMMVLAIVLLRNQPEILSLQDSNRIVDHEAATNRV